MGGAEKERERERERIFKQLPAEPKAWRGLNPRTLRSYTQPKSRVNSLLTDWITQGPLKFTLYSDFLCFLLNVLLIYLFIFYVQFLSSLVLVSTHSQNYVGQHIFLPTISSEDISFTGHIVRYFCHSLHSILVSDCLNTLVEFAYIGVHRTVDFYKF